MESFFNISRRRVLKWSISLTAYYPLVGLGLQGCTEGEKKQSSNKKRSSKERETTSNKPTEFLFYNPKKRVLHYPGIRKNEKTDFSGFQKIPIADWQTFLTRDDVKLAKETSGIVIEKLALRHFRLNANADGIKKSLALTEKVFSKDYVRSNKFNWRLYDLLVQWVALDESITDKQAHFSGAIQGADVDLIKKVPKRMSWLKSSEGVEKKLAYIQQQKDKYTERLQKRNI